MEESCPQLSLPVQSLRTLLFSVLAVGINGCALHAATPPIPDPTAFNVRSFGAKGDGQTLDTNAINAAINAAATHGGTVFFPAGTYLSFSIHLQSNVTICLDRAATVLAATPARGTGLKGAVVAFAQPTIEVPTSPKSDASGNPLTYDPPEPNPSAHYQDFGHSHFHNSLFWGENLHDVSIVGPGTIDGKGLLREATDDDWGNKALALKSCRNVIIRDVTFFRGGHFAVLATGVDNLTVDNVTFDTNRDGIDIDCCKYVRVSNCAVNAPSDDGLCLKSSFALGVARPTENVAITNCQLTGFVMGSLIDGTFNRSNTRGEGPFGRIKFGTESNGGFKNIAISNCVFDHSRGLALETVDGGTIEDITIDNLAMHDMSMPPIFIRIGNRARGPEGQTPIGIARRITISNIVASDVQSRFPCLIAGLPDHPIEDVHISNVRIKYKGGGTADQAAATPGENEKGYPEPSMFGTLPSSAFFIRHAKGVQMDHIDVSYDRPDARPAVALIDVNGAAFEHMNIQRFDNIPLFQLSQVKSFSTESVRSLSNTTRDAVDNEAIH